ncbi:MAG: helix-turn-helix transcriptional regulator [Bacteroidetes bacterium]|nr:helix-turn-helix transcriptional regulator [Bacteroidota bacterium]
MLSDKIYFLDAFNPRGLAGILAGRVRKRRLANNLSQETLARKSGVSLGTLKRFENQHEISLKHLLILAVALQATEEFGSLFPELPYQRLDDMIKEQSNKKAATWQKKGLTIPL